MSSMINSLRYRDPGGVHLARFVRANVYILLFDCTAKRVNHFTLVGHVIDSLRTAATRGNTMHQLVDIRARPWLFAKPTHYFSTHGVDMKKLLFALSRGSAKKVQGIVVVQYLCTVRYYLLYYQNNSVRLYRYGTVPYVRSYVLLVP